MRLHRLSKDSDESEEEEEVSEGSEVRRSKYTGVYWHTARQTWGASIRHGSIVQHLGYFEKEEDAALAYDSAARRLRGAVL